MWIITFTTYFIFAFVIWYLVVYLRNPEPPKSCLYEVDERINTWLIPYIKNSNININYNNKLLFIILIYKMKKVKHWNMRFQLWY